MLVFCPSETPPSKYNMHVDKRGIMQPIQHLPNKVKQIIVVDLKKS